jgi:hypothetical protein
MACLRRVVTQTAILGHCSRFLTSTRGNLTTNMQCDPQMSVDLILPSSILVTDIRLLRYRDFNLTNHPSLPLKKGDQSVPLGVLLKPLRDPRGWLLVRVNQKAFPRLATLSTFWPRKLWHLVRGMPSKTTSTNNSRRRVLSRGSLRLIYALLQQDSCSLLKVDSEF